MRRIETMTEVRQHAERKKRILRELGIDLSYSDAERLATAKSIIQVDNIARAIIQRAD